MQEPGSSLVDLLDRVLERGLVVDADIVISLAGVPLIGIKLRAALAGMETMVRYGVMTELDSHAWQQPWKAPGPDGALREPDAERGYAAAHRD